MIVLCGYPVLCALRNALNKYDKQKLESSKKQNLKGPNGDPRLSRLSDQGNLSR